MRDVPRLLLVTGLACAALGLFFHKGLLAMLGVVLLFAALLLRSLAPRSREPLDVERPRFGPTTVASTVPGARRPFDSASHD